MSLGRLVLIGSDLQNEISSEMLKENYKVVTYH